MIVKSKSFYLPYYSLAFLAYHLRYSQSEKLIILVLKNVRGNLSGKNFWVRVHAAEALISNILK